MKPYCVEIETSDKLLYLAFRSDNEVYGWMDDIYSRSPRLGVSQPTNFVHQVHVGFDPKSGGFTVSRPNEWSISSNAFHVGSTASVVETSHFVCYHQRGSCPQSRSCTRCSSILHPTASWQCSRRIPTVPHANCFKSVADNWCCRHAFRRRRFGWATAPAATTTSISSIHGTGVVRSDHRRARSAIVWNWRKSNTSFETTYWNWLV